MAKLVQHLSVPVDIIVATPEGDGTQKTDPVVSRPGVNIVHLEHPPAPPWWFSRLTHLARWSYGASAFAAARADKPLAICSFSNPFSIHWAVRRLKRKWGVPWLAFFSDPWLDNPLSKISRGRRFLLRLLERSVFRDADALVFTSQETLDQVLRRFPAEMRKKAHVVGHGFDDRYYNGRGAPPSYQGTCVIRHTGQFSGVRSPRPLFAALEKILRDEPGLLREVRLELIGNNKKVTVPESLKGLVALTPPVGFSDSIRLMEEANALLLIDAPSELSVFFPSKLADYLGTDRPILALTPPGTSARIMKKAGGVIADPADPDAVLRAATSFLRDLKAEKLELKAEQRSYRESFSIKNQAREFEKILLSIVGAP